MRSINEVATLAQKNNMKVGKYIPYHNGYIFIDEKDRGMTPYRIYDNDTNTIGNFSPAFDLDHFFTLFEKAIDYKE